PFFDLPVLYAFVGRLAFYWSLLYSPKRVEHDSTVGHLGPSFRCFARRCLGFFSWMTDRCAKTGVKFSHASACHFLFSYSAVRRWVAFGQSMNEMKLSKTDASFFSSTIPAFDCPVFIVDTV